MKGQRAYKFVEIVKLHYKKVAPVYILYCTIFSHYVLPNCLILTNPKCKQKTQLFKIGVSNSDLHLHNVY